jgi:hypothetical protein
MSSQEKKKTSKTKNKIKKEERYSKQNVLYTIVSKRRKKPNPKQRKKEEKTEYLWRKKELYPSWPYNTSNLSNIAAERTT